MVRDQLRFIFPAPARRNRMRSQSLGFISLAPRTPLCRVYPAATDDSRKQTIILCLPIRRTYALGRVLHGHLPGLVRPSLSAFDGPVGYLGIVGGTARRRAAIPDGGLPMWAWLWFPPLLIILQLGFRAYDERLYRDIFEGELGVVELATPAVLLFAIGFGIAAWRYRGVLPRPWLRGWLVAVILGCVYFAGEELSWGQHLFGWSTPEYLGAVNEQQETNAHNISSWFDQKPRLLLELWVLIGGIIYPLMAHRSASDPRAWQPWFWPGMVCLPSAVLAILVRLPERFKEWFDLGPLPLELRYSEPQEYYFGLFLALYMAAYWARLRAAGIGRS